MKNTGIRISDKENRILSVELSSILDEIHNGNSLYWCILFLDGFTHPEEGKFISELQKKILESENGLIISWKDLQALSTKFHQMFEIIILGCKNKNLLHYYEDEIKMYEICDVAIQLIDCAFWEVFSKDHELIARLGKKFKEIKFLKPDFIR